MRPSTEGVDRRNTLRTIISPAKPCDLLRIVLVREQRLRMLWVNIHISVALENNNEPEAF